MGIHGWLASQIISIRIPSRGIFIQRRLLHVTIFCRRFYEYPARKNSNWVLFRVLNSCSFYITPLILLKGTNQKAPTSKFAKRDQSECLVASSKAKAGYFIFDLFVSMTI